jgi:hypothetical protein
MPKQEYAKLPVCKPCWELKYCPYGIMVETMPFAEGFDHGETREQMYERAIKTLKETDFTDDGKIWRNMFFVMLADTSKWNCIKNYKPDDVRCNIFGHACPVFFYAYEGVTETKELRRKGRSIPRDVMLQVIRRDNYRCRKCGKLVPDDEVEFDHIIPHAKGGPLSVENIRLLCRSCNRKKSDSMAELLED